MARTRMVVVPSVNCSGIHRPMVESLDLITMASRLTHDSDGPILIFLYPSGWHARCLHAALIGKSLPDSHRRNLTGVQKVPVVRTPALTFPLSALFGHGRQGGAGGAAIDT